jgi:hypothetical protein
VTVARLGLIWDFHTMINHLSEEEFVQILHTHVSPTSPIQSEEHLFGRRRQIELVQQALYAPGRSIFIYGDRGVGKTSLAQTVAYTHQSATHDPIMLACEPHYLCGIDDKRPCLSENSHA